MFYHFWQKFENSGRHFWGGENFLKIVKITFLRYPVGRKFRRNRSISHGLGNMSTFAFFSIQNSQLLIYLINYSLIYEAITPKSNPIQAINPMSIPNFRKLGLKHSLKCLETKELQKSSYYSVSLELLSPKASHTAINPINLHAKFGKDRIRTVA